MLLRIEDLDPERSKTEFIRALYEDLRWLGLDWDEEMPLQSKRNEVYAQHFQKLDTYPCYCSRGELHSASAPHTSDGRIIYPGTCRNLPPQTQTKKVPSWRAAVDDCTISFTDGVFGDVEQNVAHEWGDFIVRRTDGVYTYQLAVVCDDALGGVTEVVRGCDLLSSTPIQIWLYQRLGLPVPKFYHVPLLVAPDGRRLSKREKDLDISNLKQRFSPEEVIGKLAYRANLTHDDAPINPSQLLKFFSWDKIGTAPIVIDDSF